jgi:hypothetical protein
MTTVWRNLAGVLAIVLALAAAAASPTRASLSVSALESGSLGHAQTIRAELDARYRSARRGGLAVTEASSTGVVESFTLLTPDLFEERVLPAHDGIYYAVCPVGASCPYPAKRFARPAADLDVRRLALELAVRTFLETSADVVAVSLPVRRYIALIAERGELAREVDLETMAKALESDRSRPLWPSVQAIVDRVTRPRIFVAMGLEPTPSGSDSWLGMPRWPA